MAGVSAMGLAVQPKPRVASSTPAISLETAVPKSFGQWRALPDQLSLIVNPQAEQALYGVYSQVLARTYVDEKGYRIMLSIAYNDDERGGLQTHRPEVCYPAQGFQVHKTEEGRLPTPFGDIEVRRLNTSLGKRQEPVTYWLTVGDEVVVGRLNKRLAEIRMSLTGRVPDGLLFRVSSIDDDSSRAYAAQQRFAADMVGALPVTARKQLSGLTAQAAP
jgi:EpsI family protein